MDACRYIIAKFVPDPIRDEPINIGVILQCPSRKFASCRFLDNFQRITRMRPEVEVQILKDFSEDFRLRINVFSNPLEQLLVPEPLEHQPAIGEYFLNELADHYGNRFQFTEPRPILVGDLNNELGHLFETFVEDRVLISTQQRVTHYRLKERLHSFFNKYQLIGTTRIQSQFNYPGKIKTDGYMFDFGRDNHNISIYQSVALDTKTEDEKIDKAYILKGRIDDVREAAKNKDRTVMAYAITYLLPQSSKDYVGTTEATKIMSENDIEIVRFDDEHLHPFMSRLRQEIVSYSI